jgi:hypothetical protein
MKPRLLFTATLSFALVVRLAAGAVENWAGEYSDQNFLDGKAVFQLTIEQSGNAIQVSFDGAYKDAHGAAPEGQGKAKSSRKDTLDFKFEDSFGNTGTGTIQRANNDIIVSINPTHVVEARCLAFYGKNMRLKRATKK